MMSTKLSIGLAAALLMVSATAFAATSDFCSTGR